jgi:hypothetical protein
MAEPATMTIIAFPPSAKTAHRVARQLRTDGFWTLPLNLWHGAADLVEVFAEYPPTPTQLAWLTAAHRQFLNGRMG